MKDLDIWLSNSTCAWTSSCISFSKDANIDYYWSMVQESLYGATNVTQYTTPSEFKEMHPKYFMNRDMLQNIPVQY